ncbi:hypothetical protein PTKIN_Ptkin15bG0150400 [Pterospermum kingtungense]
MVDNRYGGKMDDFTPQVNNHRRFSGVWRNITKPLTVSNDLSSCLVSGIGYLLGDGKSIQFWHHEWIPGMILKYSFPRIFALVTNKDAKVAKCGEFIDGVWHWSLILRRRLFNWEVTSWNGLLEIIKDFCVYNSLKDAIVWKPDSHGKKTLDRAVGRKRFGLGWLHLRKVWESWLASRVRQISSSWIRPEVGCFKFNVDGSAHGKPGPVGISGVMRDHEEAVKILFSIPIGIADSNLDELLAIREAFLLFTALQWSCSHNLVIESDSSNAVKWVNFPFVAPWAMRSFLNQIEALKSRVLNWRVVHVNREINFVVDTLAKEAALREDELIEFFK